MSKATILNNISNALKSNPLKSESAVYQDIILPVEQDKIKEYKRLQNFNKAEVFEVSETEIAQTLQDIFQRENISKALISQALAERFDFSIPTLVYNQSMEDLKDELFSIECGVLEADYGVANLGVMAVTSSSNQPRLLSLITKHCIMLVKKEKILANLSEVLKEVKKSNPNLLPSNILFIAGPSRTADIELQVVFGVHGPQNVYVILY